MSSQPHTLLVTGANKGIGYEAVKILSQQLPKSTVLLGSRTIANGDAAIAKMKESVPSHAFDNIRVVAIDVTKSDTMTQAVDMIRSEYGQLDVLLHNSGIARVNDSFIAKEILDVNTVGAHDILECFLPIIPKQGKIIVVSSDTGSWAMDNFNQKLQSLLDDPKQMTWAVVERLMHDWVAFSKGEPHTEEWPPIVFFTGAYTTSKALVTAYLRNFALTHPDVQLAIVCPGYCATDLNQHAGPRPASKGGESVVWPVFNAFKSGDFYQDGQKHAFISETPQEFKGH